MQLASTGNAKNIILETISKLVYMINMYYMIIVIMYGYNKVVYIFVKISHWKSTMCDNVIKRVII